MDGEGARREDIIAKIRKLFALSKDNPSKHEAVAAALKAQRLMADNGIEGCELHGDGAEAQKIGESCTGTALRRWRWHLACAIGDNFRCRHYGQSLHRRHRMVFFGYESDAQAASLTFDYLYKAGDRLAAGYAREVRRAGGTGRGVYNDYVLGFTAGVRQEMEKQTQALMLVVPQAVAEGFEEMSGGFAKADSRLLTAGRAEAEEEGRRAGRDAVRERRVGAGEAPAQAEEGKPCLGAGR